MVVVHALQNHDFDSVARDFKRFDEGIGFRYANRCFRFHFCCPVSESKSLVCEEGSNVNFDDSSLEYIFALKVLKHLGLCGMHHIAKIHVVSHLSFESDFD